MKDETFKFSLLSSFHNLIHGYSSRSYGDMRFGNLDDSEVQKNRNLLFRDLGITSTDVITCNQTHGAKIAEVKRGDRGKGIINIETAIPETDGIVTHNKDIFLMIKTADCLPIFLYDPEAEIVGLVHAGWRGIIGQIIPRGVEKIIELGGKGENIIAGIGPGICQKHFIVKNGVLKQFLASYPSSTMIRHNNGYVDLKKAVLNDLQQTGVRYDNIEVSPFCTVCDNRLFGSFRKEGNGAPESASIIGMIK